MKGGVGCNEAPAVQQRRGLIKLSIGSRPQLGSEPDGPLFAPARETARS